MHNIGDDDSFIHNIHYLWMVDSNWNNWSRKGEWTFHAEGGSGEQSWNCDGHWTPYQLIDCWNIHHQPQTTNTCNKCNVAVLFTRNWLFVVFVCSLCSFKLDLVCYIPVCYSTSRHDYCRDQLSKRVVIVLSCIVLFISIFIFLCSTFSSMIVISQMNNTYHLHSLCSCWFMIEHFCMCF